MFMNILMYLLVCGVFVHTEWRTAQCKSETVERKLHKSAEGDFEALSTICSRVSKDNS